jgi:hypothetical protein
MTIAVGGTTCTEPERHEWVLRSIDFEDLGPVSVYECLRCGRVDHRDGRR